MVDLVGLATPGARATAFTAQNSSPQAGMVLPAQMSAVVVNEMGRRGRRRSQDHAPRHSPPDAHSPHMGRGSCRTDGAWSIFGVGAPRITRRGIHRPMLIPCTWVVVPAGLMGRGRSRGVGDPRITRHGIHRPKLVTPSRDGVARPDERGRGSCRTDGAWSIFGVGDPKITRRGIHRPMLIPRTWVVVPAGLMGK